MPLDKYKPGQLITSMTRRAFVDLWEEIQAGTILAKTPRKITKTTDITGGLPRVAELFESRRPKDPAIISEIDGTVEFSTTKKGQREIIVTSSSC